MGTIWTYAIEVKVLHTPRGNNSTSVHVLKGKAHSYIQTHVEYTKIHHIFSLKANVSKFYKVTHYKHSPITMQSHNKLSTKFKNEKGFHPVNEKSNF